MHRWRARGAAGLLILLALLLSACGEGASARAQDAANGAVPGTSALPVRIARAWQGTVSAVWQGNATLMARDDAQLSARLGGEVAEVYVDVGDRVRRGQPLARLDRERLQLEAERARAIYRQRKAEAERSEGLLERRLVSEEAHDRAVSDAATARAEYDLAALSVREATLTAPFDGVVAERYISRGNTIAAGEAAFRLVSADALEARVAVPEGEVTPLAVGQPAELSADALPGARIAAEVTRIAPAVDVDSGTVDVVLKVTGDDPRLAPGMFVRARIVHQRREDAVLVPPDALLREDGTTAVFVAEHKGAERVARRVPVETGFAEADRVEIRSGISAGTPVVTSGRTGLRDGTPLVDVSDTLAETGDASGAGAGDGAGNGGDG